MSQGRQFWAARFLPMMPPTYQCLTRGRKQEHFVFQQQWSAELRRHMLIACKRMLSIVVGVVKAVVRSRLGSEASGVGWSLPSTGCLWMWMIRWFTCAHAVGYPYWWFSNDSFATGWFYVSMLASVFLSVSAICQSVCCFSAFLSYLSFCLSACVPACVPACVCVCVF